MSDETAEPVQPGGTDEGQGGEGTESSAPYAEYLDRVPSEVRETIEPIFKEWDGNVTRKFQEKASLEQSWQPYEEVGIKRLSPEEAQWHMEFHEALGNPQLIQQWYQAYAAEHGLTPAQAEAELGQQQQYGQQTDPFGTTDEFAYQDPAAQQRQYEQMLQQQLTPVQQRLEQISQWQEQQELQARQAEAKQFVDGQIGELKKAHPDDPMLETAVERLVGQYIQNDPRNAVQRAYQDWESMKTQIEKATLQAKVNQPPSPEGGGAANGAPDEIKGMKSANEAALAMMKQMHRS